VSAAAVAALQAVSQPAAVAPVPTLDAAAGAAPDAAGRFGQLVTNGLSGLNDNLLAAQAGMQSLAAGTAPDLHRVMAQIEESQLSFQLMLQVRNRLLQAYDDVMKMQV
jgi:flagellar hook-basal body complex protein FliE